jgi:hypothetical protein
VSVVLQNRHPLDLLTAEKGETCLFLDDECCFYTNKSGVVSDMAGQLRECIAKRSQELANSWSSGTIYGAGLLGHYFWLTSSLCFFWHPYLGLV